MKRYWYLASASAISASAAPSPQIEIQAAYHHSLWKAPASGKRVVRFQCIKLRCIGRKAAPAPAAPSGRTSLPPRRRKRTRPNPNLRNSRVILHPPRPFLRSCSGRLRRQASSICIYRRANAAGPRRQGKVHSPTSTIPPFVNCESTRKRQRSHLPYTLPSSVSRNFFICHSYENTRGVGVFFPFWYALRAVCDGNWLFCPELPIGDLDPVGTGDRKLTTLNYRRGGRWGPEPGVHRSPR